MLAWLDRLVGAIVGSLGGIAVAVIGVGQLFVTSILVRMLLNHGSPVAWRAWIEAAFLFALGTSLLALGAWLVRQAFREQNFKL